MKKFWRVVVWLVVIGAALAFFVPHFIGDHKPPAHTGGRRGVGAPGQPTPVLQAAAKAADVPVYIEGVGTVKPLLSVLVRSQVDGVIKSMPFQEGQDVHKGDLLVQIDPSLYQAAYDQAVAKKAQDEASLTNAQLDLQRYVNLAKTNAATQQQLDTQHATVAGLQAQVKVDAAAMDSAATTLSYTHIVSPIDGRTGLRVVDPGNLVHASDATGLVTVSQIQPISVIFVVPQQQLARIIKSKATGTLTVDALDNAAQAPIDSGTLDVIDNTVDQTTGTVKLKAIFPNKNLQLWPGGFVTVRLLIETLKQAIVIPVGALQRGPKGTFVYVVTDNTVHVTPVKAGQQDDKEAVIKSGLKAGDMVVTTGFVKLTDGAKVTATQDQAATSDTSSPALHQATGALPPPADAGTPPSHSGGHGHRRGQPSQTQ